MKNTRLIAIFIISLIIINSLSINFIQSLISYKNNSNSRLNSPNADNLLMINGNPENIFSFYSDQKSSFAPLRIVTFIGENSRFYDKDFVYLAAIPIALYNENRILKVSPILFDDLGFGSVNFLKDWRNYCNKFDSWDGIKNIIYIGNISTQTKNSAKSLLNPNMTTPVHIVGNSTYELAANIATYFWYKPDTVVLAPIDDTYPAPETTTITYSSILNGNGMINKKGIISGSALNNYYSKANVTTLLNSGGIYAEINETSKLALELFGNFTKSTRWMYDTNKLTKSNWVFFPNVTFPADMSDWGLRIYNTTPIYSPVSYNLTFYNLAFEMHHFQINNSESQFDTFLTWGNPADDLNFWVLDPSNQLLSASSRSGNLYQYQNGSTSKSSRFLYPTTGTWTVLITRPRGTQPIAYNLTINVTEFSSYRRQCIESAANGAVIASLLDKPLLYVSNGTIPIATGKALSTLGVKRVILVDPFNLTSNRGFFNALKVLNIQLNLGANLTSRVKVYNYIYSLSRTPDIVISSINNGFFAPASLIAAFHGAPLLFSLNQSYNIHAESLKNFAVDYWIGFQNPGDSALLRESLPRFQDMKRVSDVFYNWLNSLNLNKSGNETVLVVSPIWELNPYFDRALYGKAFVGRLLAENSGDLAAFICRNILYPALSYSNSSFKYESEVENLASEGNSTKTGRQLYATNFGGTVTSCQLNDGVYHSYYNGSKGQIVMAYYVNMSDFQILFTNITQVRIALDGKISYSNSQIKLAGWAIWNWTARNYKMIDGSALNSTSDRSDDALIDITNKSSFILPTNSRIEIFIFVNTSGASVRASIDYINFTVTHSPLLNNPKMVSSSIVYWNTFTYQGKTYNFSSLIPLNFTQNGYQVKNVTGYQAIYSELTNNCKLWYYSGNSTLPSSEFGKEGNLLFTQTNYWRAFGDYSDSKSTPNNPDADGDHFVTPNATLAKWQTGLLEFNRSLSQLHSSFVLLQDGYAGATSLPEYLMLHGASIVIADLKQNVLGYSEYFAYRGLNELLKGKSLGIALFKAFNQTSHLYAQNWQGNVIGTAPFSNYTEENQQFILYGDPSLTLLNRTFDLPKPTSYRPLIHGFYNYTFRENYPLAMVLANITDLDSDLTNEVRVRFNVTGTILGADPLIRDYQQGSHYTTWTNSYYNFYGSTKFDYPSCFPREPLGYKTFNFNVSDSTNFIQLSVLIYLRSSPPHILDITTLINDTGIYHAISHSDHDTIGRLNESLFVRFQVQDRDHNGAIPDIQQLNFTLILTNLNDNSSIVRPLKAEPDIIVDDGTSYWNLTYVFSAFNSTGKYNLDLRLEDSDKEVNNPHIDYFYIINWPPQKNGTNFVTINATGPTHQIFRVNETVQVSASVFDVDGNQTHVKAVSLCFKKGTNKWINISMSDQNLDNNWSAAYVFSALNESGAWLFFIKATDKDNRIGLFNSSTYLTVMNLPPNPPFGLAMKNVTTQIAISALLRNTTISLFANATDLDVSNRITQLKLYACLKDPSGKVRYQNLMTYDNETQLWMYNFTPKITDKLGSWTYYVHVRDEVNAYANSTGNALQIKNNIPVIKTVGVSPDPYVLNIGETLSINGEAYDVEAFGNITVFIEDLNGKIINKTQTLVGKSTYDVKFTPAEYSGLKTEGTWNITIKLMDKDGGNTTSFSFGGKQNIITISIRSSGNNGGHRFPYEIIIIIAIIVTTVLATYLVYRTRKKEITVIPAARVKQIIKKISKEKEEEAERAQAEIKSRMTAIQIKPAAGATASTVKKELTEDEKEENDRKMRNLVKDAQNLLEENQYEKAAMAYHDAAKLATNLGKYEMARVYSDKGEEILRKKAELPKKKKVKEVEKKKKPEKLLGKAKIESIKVEIGELMRNARKALREDDFISASKYYKEVAQLYRQIFDEEKAQYFEGKANEIL